MPKSPATPMRLARTALTMTVGELIAAIGQEEPGPLNILAASRLLPIKTAYRVARLLEMVKPDLISFQKTWQILFEKYGEPSKVEGQEHMREVPKDSPDMPKFLHEQKELLEQEIVVPWEPLAIEDIPDGILSSNDLTALGKFIRS